ncbi:unnamed protein product [Ilex paraguariensis]|uniref:Uncharacterized protein n=1 Tax=Ilex paraguariensis TaxID=185542 RepID=A0ABC8QTY7_9AQUA
MLEGACGQRPIKVQGFDYTILVQWVLEKWQGGAILEASDPRLGVSRPSMRQVMQYLDGDAILPEVFMDAAGVGMAALVGNEMSNEFAMTFPSSSSENISSSALSGTESLLYVGR